MEQEGPAVRHSMKRLRMTNFSVRFPWLILVAAVAVTVFFGAQFPKVSFDNDPENMLAADEPIRVFHNKVKAQYNLFDFVIVGIVNGEHPDGIFNVETLGRIDALTRELISLRRNESGPPEVMRDGGRLRSYSATMSTASLPRTAPPPSLLRKSSARAWWTTSSRPTADSWPSNT
jgi:hypothetical protein